MLGLAFTPLMRALLAGGVVSVGSTTYVATGYVIDGYVV